MYKGSIEVDSTPGEGTTMTVILPIEPLSEEEGLVPAADSQESPPAGSDSQG